MINKITVVFLAFLFILSFSACSTKSTPETVSKTASSETIQSDDSSEESMESNESEAVLESSNVIDGIYYGEGIQFTIPEGYVLYSEEGGTVYFFAEEILSMIRLSVDATDKTIEDLTEEKMSGIADENTFIVSFDPVSIDGVAGVCLVYNEYLDVTSDEDTSTETTEESSKTISDTEESSPEFDETREYSTTYFYTVIINEKMISLVFYTEDNDITETISSVIDSVLLG